MKNILILIFGSLWISIGVHGQQMKWQEPCTENPGFIDARIWSYTDMDTLKNNKPVHQIAYFWKLTNNGNNAVKLEYYNLTDLGWKWNYTYLKPDETQVMKAFYLTSDVDVSSTNMWFRVCWKPWKPAD